MPRSSDNTQQDLSLALALPEDSVSAAAQLSELAQAIERLKEYHAQWQEPLARLDLATSLLSATDSSEASDDTPPESAPINHTAEANAWLSTLSRQSPDTWFNRLKAGANLANAAAALSGAIATTGPAWLAVPAGVAGGGYWVFKNQQVNQQNFNQYETNQQQLISLTEQVRRLQAEKDHLLPEQEGKLEQITARVDAMEAKSRAGGDDERTPAGADMQATITGQGLTLIFFILTVLKIIALSIFVTRPRDEADTQLNAANITFLVVDVLLSAFQVLGVAHRTGRARRALAATGQGSTTVTQDTNQLERRIIRRAVQGMEDTTGMKTHRQLVQAGRQVRQYEEMIDSIATEIITHQTNIGRFAANMTRAQTTLTAREAERDRLLAKEREGLSETERVSLNQLVERDIPRGKAAVDREQENRDSTTTELQAAQQRQSVCKAKLVAVVRRQQMTPLSMLYRQELPETSARDTAESSAERSISQSATQSHASST